VEKELCPKCGRRLAPERRPGSLTSYLFGAVDCNCATAPRSAAAGAKSDDTFNFCARCGLRIDDKDHGGSLTGFLFQSTRCKCPADENFAEGRMSAKFWKLKKGGGSNIFTSAPSDSHAGARRGRAPSIDLASGAIIGGVYKIIRLIGLGGMGEVYLATHEALDKKCALKVIPPDQVTEVGWQRFQLEAKAVAKLEHINLVKVTDLGIHDGCLPYYAMDYIEGQNLADILTEKGHLSLSTTMDIFSQVCSGVECAHRGGILHRDLKPANLMLTRAANGKLIVKVLDFGLAKLTKQDRSHQSLTAVGDVFGSPYYMSPEQCNGEKLDNRSDIYSLGCAMFECLTGQPPFAGNKPTAIIFSQLEADPPTLESIVGPGKLPASIEVVMAKLLRKNPAERYQTMAQVKADLKLVAAGKDVAPVYQSRQKTVHPVRKATLASAVMTGVNAAAGGSANVRAAASLRLVLASGMIFLLFVGGTFVWYLNRVSPKVLVPARSEAVSEFTELKISDGDDSETHKSSVEKFAALDSNVSAVEGLGLDSMATLPGKDAHWKGETFYKGIVTRGGKRYAQWTFPSNLNSAMNLKFDENGKTRVVALTGSVYVPADSSVCIIFKPEMARSPRYLDGLRDGTFNHIEAKSFSAAVLVMTAEKCAKFKSVTGLTVGNVTWTLSDCLMSLQGIEKFPNLKRLHMYCIFEGKLLHELFSKVPLEEFVFQLGSPDCMDEIARASSLKRLAILVCMNHPADIKKLIPSPSLESLMVGQLSGSALEMTNFSRMRCLKELDLPDLRDRVDLIPDLQRLKNLRVLKFSGRNWSPERINMLRRALPRVKVLPYESAEAGESQLFKS